jgi:hypothetical protein
MHALCCTATLIGSVLYFIYTAEYFRNVDFIVSFKIIYSLADDTSNSIVALYMYTVL